jgi:LysM repeat protein
MTPRPIRLATAFLGLTACLTFNSCQDTGGSSRSGSSDVVDYTSPTSKMSKKEKDNYAFDDSGHYRENWVASNSGAKVKTPLTSPTTMSTDSPYVQERASERPSSTPPTSAAYAEDTPASTPSPKKSVASNSSGSSGTKKSGSSSPGRKSTASKSSGSKKSSTTASSKSKKPAAKSTAKAEVVTVKSGDTLYGLSRKTGVPIEKIKSYNGMKSDLLVDGKTIKIPPKH